MTHDVIYSVERLIFAYMQHTATNFYTIASYKHNGVYIHIKDEK